MARKKENQIGSAWVATIIILTIIVVMIAAGFVIVFILKKNNTSTQAITAQPASSGQPDIRVSDFDPALANSQKTAILVKHSDSTFDKFIMANTSVNNFIKSLPADDVIISKTPLQ